MKADYISLEQAKNIIVEALDQFDPALVTRAAEILYNQDRLNVVEVAEAQTNMMMCRPAGVTIDDVKAGGMYIPDFAQKFGPHFTRQDNPADHAIIDFEYDGTPRSIVWMAHELGHAIADDIQRENGRSFRDFSSGEQEEQAYFVQHIVSGYIKEHLERPDVKDTDLGQDVLAMSWERAAQFTNAANTFDHALTTASSMRSDIVLKALDQKLG